MTDKTADWEKAFSSDIDDAWVMGLATGKGWDTNLAKNVMEKLTLIQVLAYLVQISSKQYLQISKEIFN